MKVLIFWQNVISPHQYPYISSIHQVDNSYKVVLVVEKEMSVERRKMGWINPYDSSDKVKLIVSPDREKIHSIFIEFPDAYHFYSGLRAYKMVFTAFRISLQFPVKRYLITEGPSFYKRPLILQYFKTWTLEKKYYNKIDKVYAIGSHAQKWYPKFGFKEHQIIPFCYCVNNINIPTSKSLDGVLHLIYVGTLSDLKSVNDVITSLDDINCDYTFDIVGDGPEKENLVTLVKKYNLDGKINFHGYLNNKRVQEIINENDVLILPSKYDGWGAVINEALMSGLFVICSDQCGAKVLIEDGFNGTIFSRRIKNDLTSKLKYCISNIDNIRDAKPSIIKWSKCIQPRQVARYLLQTFGDDFDRLY